ncbi:MAG: GNAT family N-acetyltransferase [Chloroflexota bacterium]
MSIAFKLREMTPDDSPAIASLTAESPDGGMISFSQRFHVPLHEAFAARYGNMLGVVAEMAQRPGIVGAARVSFGECQFEGRVLPYALLSALMVHPDYRRQGIATALAQRRIEWAYKRSGGDTILLANIQKGNAPSTANAKKWSNQIAGQVLVAPITMRTNGFRPTNGIRVRDANEDDLAQSADHLNTFYRDYNFYRPHRAETLRDWLQQTPLPTPINHYLVATDSTGRVLAGIGIHEECRLMSLHVEKAPALMNLANRFLKIIPKSGEMRNLEVEKLWFVPGQLEAARQLWQTIRWEWREQGSSLLCSYDPRSPISQIIENPAWMPTTSTSIALRSPVSMSEGRLIDPIL